MSAIPPLTDLTYHPHVALVTFLEEPHAVRLAGPPADALGLSIHTRIRHELTRSCALYRQRLADNVADYAVRAGRGVEPLRDYLYNPALWVAFGRADAVAVALFDDFDPIVSLMAEIRSPIVQAAVAFCPKMGPESLGVAGPFEDLADWFDAPPPRQKKPGPTDTEYPAPDHDPHPRLADTPLLVVSRFKVGGMAALNGGTAVQQAVLRSMAKLIVNELDALGRAADAGDPRVVGLGVSAADVRAVRCTFLDGQGSEDVILLVRGTNYSVGMALVARLRCLTFGEVFATDERLAAQMDRGPVRLHAHVLRRYKRSGDTKTEWADNHIFSDTHTTLGVTETEFRTDPTAAGAAPRPAGTSALPPKWTPTPATSRISKAFSKRRTPSSRPGPGATR